MKAILVSLLVSLIGSVLTKENIKELLAVIFAFLEKEASKTNNDLDDKALGIVEKLLDEDKLVEEVDKFVKDKLGK